MDDYTLLIDLHQSGDRQGPGSDAATEMALNLAQLDPAAPLKIADLGCGTGASTLVLAQRLNAQITAVDFLPEFLEILEQHAQQQGVAEKITTLAASMDDLPFEEEQFDVIWSEGAIYNIGFANGVNQWRRYLKPGGILVASELTWITASRPREIQDHWQAEYPEVDVASAKLNILEQQGYAPIGYFILPESSWLETYYHPMEDRFDDFLKRHNHSEAAAAIVTAERHEIDLYKTYRDYISYGVYVARKIA